MSSVEKLNAKNIKVHFTKENKTKCTLQSKKNTHLFLKKVWKSVRITLKNVKTDWQKNHP